MTGPPLRTVPHIHFFLSHPTDQWDCNNQWCGEPDGIGWRPWGPSSPPANVLKARGLERLSEIQVQRLIDLFASEGEPGLSNQMRGIQVAIAARVRVIVGGQGG